MINELYQLSVAMKKAGISVPNWHRKYKLIPKATENAPCFKLTAENATRTTRNNILGNENIEHTNDEQNLE